MSLVVLLAPAAAASLLSYLLTPAAGRLAQRIGAVDRPGPRKIHSHPVPRLGGLAVIVSVAICGVVFERVLPTALPSPPFRLLLGVALGLVPIAGISIRDDMRPLGPAPKALAHLAGALIAVTFGVSLHHDIHLFGHTVAIGWLAFPVSVLWLIGTANAFNIVDGLDGLAAGLGLISACGLCGVFLIVGEDVMARYALLLAGAIAGFLPYNLFPARMFFGDTGATAIGFCLGAFALRGGATLSAGFAAMLPVVVLGMPVAETLISMTRRAVCRLATREGGIFQPDRNHIHHRLLALGVGHRRAVLLLYGAGAALGAVALLSTLLSGAESALLLLTLLLAGCLGVRRLGYDEFAIIRNGTVLRAYDRPALNSSMFAVLVDVTIVAVAAAAAVGLKTDGDLLRHRSQIFSLMAALAPVTVAVFWRLGLYRGTWRLAGTDDFVRASCAVTIASLLGMTARMLLTLSPPPLTLFAIYTLAALLLVTASRASYLILVASRWRVDQAGSPTLIYGAGRKGALALRELIAAPAPVLRPVAFIDDDAGKQGRMLNGLPIVGSIRTIERALHRFAARTVVIAADGLPVVRQDELRRRCEDAGVALLKIRVSLDSVGAAAVPAADAPARTAIELPRAAVRFEDAGLPLAVMAAQGCPACGSRCLHRSHVRKMSERVRKRLTEKRLFRCDACGWRGWDLIVDAAACGPFPAVERAPLRADGP